jgi:hypothetical protein
LPTQTHKFAYIQLFFGVCVYVCLSFAGKNKSLECNIKMRNSDNNIAAAAACSRLPLLGSYEHNNFEI